MPTDWLVSWCPIRMRSFLFCLLTILSIDTQAESMDPSRIETRYGIVDVAEHSDTVDLRFRGKLVRSVAALGASLYRVTPHGQREFVIVDNLTPGLHCRHVYVLIELRADGKAMASEPFGECKELEGVEFHAESPIVRLKEPASLRKSSVSARFEWRNGKIVELPGSVTARPASGKSR